MLDTARLIPAYGMNLGTVGFLMNRYRPGTNLKRRLAQARPMSIRPIRMQAVTQTGATCKRCAINESSGERRGGKECVSTGRSRWDASHEKKKNRNKKRKQ